MSGSVDLTGGPAGYAPGMPPMLLAGGAGLLALLILIGVALTRRRA
jgi:hypothetical protein